MSSDESDRDSGSIQQQLVRFWLTQSVQLVQIAHMEIGNKVCHGKSEKRLVGKLLEDMVLIHDVVVFEE